MLWTISHRADRKARLIADRHYNRQKPGTPQFMPTGSCVVFYCRGAVWGTSWPQAAYTQHAWPGAWNNSLFRNESDLLSSTLIRQAVAATRWHYELRTARRCTPPLGMITFVDPAVVPGFFERGVLKWGYCSNGPALRRAAGLRAACTCSSCPPATCPTHSRHSV